MTRSGVKSDSGCRLRRILAVVAGLVTLAPLGAAPCFAATPSIWQRVTFAPIAIPGTDQFLDVNVSQEVIVGTGNNRSYQLIAAGGNAGPSFLRVDLSWSAIDDEGCRPKPKPAPIADGKEIHIALHRGAEVERSESPGSWIGLGNACGTTWAITQHFPAKKSGLDQAWIEIQAAGKTWWVELPYGLARIPLDPGIDEVTRRDPAFPASLKAASTDQYVFVPWAAVRYPLDGGGVLEMVDACDGVARVTLSDTPRWPIDSPPIAVEIHRADGNTFKGREISRSIRPRQSVFDFMSRPAVESPRSWDEVRIDVDGKRTVVTIPSSLYLLGHRLANWGDRRRIPVPDASCKDR